MSKGNSHVYLGGTIHILTENDYPLPKAFDAAYADSDRLFLEADVSKLKEPQYQQLLFAGMMYEEEQNIRQDLSDDTFVRLSQYVQQRGIPLDSVLPIRAGWLSVTLGTVELQKLGLMGVGVDQYFASRAQRDNKELAYLESVEQQIQFISDMGKGQEDALIAHTLDEMVTLPELMSGTKQAWRAGNEAEMTALLIEPLKDKFPGIYQEINVSRNKNWQPLIEQMLDTAETEFVLVGALHLIGEDGLVTYFKDRGYSVTMQ